MENNNTTTPPTKKPDNKYNPTIRSAMKCYPSTAIAELPPKPHSKMDIHRRKVEDFPYKQPQRRPRRNLGICH